MKSRGRGLNRGPKPWGSLCGFSEFTRAEDIQSFTFLLASSHESLKANPGNVAVGRNNRRYKEAGKAPGMCLAWDVLSCIVSGSTHRLAERACWVSERGVQVLESFGGFRKWGYLVGILIIRASYYLVIYIWGPLFS